jgi:hypothetical protein
VEIEKDFRFFGQKRVDRTLLNSTRLVAGHQLKVHAGIIRPRGKYMAKVDFTVVVL